MGALLGAVVPGTSPAHALGPWDFGSKTYWDSETMAHAAEAEVVTLTAKEVNPLDALVAVYDGQDALLQVLRINGSSGGYRARLRNLLPRYAKTVQVMAAKLPAAVNAYPGDDQAAMQEYTGSVLVGASTVAAMARYVEKGEFDSYADADIPFDDLKRAVRAIEELLVLVPEDVLLKAKKERCRLFINSAENYEDMKDRANSPVCADGI